jgi:hypothetical protein
MKKKFTLLFTIMLATAFQGIAQDTITGVVSRVDAPYFEQNVCDSRFAITSEGETYYVMVDNYWPNPYLEDLVIHYDTIAIGNEIEVVGEIKEMEDGNGEVFSVIDITKLIDAQNHYFISYLSWLGDLFPIAFPGPDLTDAFAIIGLNDESLSFVAIDGELQTDDTWVINGATLYLNSRYLFVGSFEIWTDYYGEPFTVFNLKNAIPYGVATDDIEGVLTLSDGLHMDVPCLAVNDGTDCYYLTIKEVLQHGYINSTLYEENTPVTVGGVKTTRYDMYGSVFFSFDIVVLQSLEEKTLYGILQDAPNPAIGMVPLPGMELAFYSGGRNYYLDNERIGIGPYGDIEAIIVGNDTLTYAMELTVTLTSTMKIDNNLEPYYRVYISKATITTSVQESSLSEIQIYPNPTKGFIEIFTEQQINSVYVYDYTGHVLFNKTCNSRQSLLDLQDYNGLVIIQIVFENGLIVNRKVVVR